MLIVCPACASQYTIDPARIGARGRTVRCAECRQTWFEAPRSGERPLSVEDLPLSDSLAPAEAAEPVPAPEPAPEPISVEATTAGDSVRRSRRERPPAPVARVPGSAFLDGRGLALILLLGLAAAGAAVAARTAVVSALPQTARLYAAIGLPVNLYGLDLRAVTAETLATEEGPFLVVEGEIANLKSGEAEVPSIEIAVRGTDGQPLYTWTNDAPRPTLGAAETVRFRARLASPPAEGRQVFVKFASTEGGREVARDGLGR